MGDGPTAIEDAEELGAVRSQASRVHRTALIAAAVATALSLLI